MKMYSKLMLVPTKVPAFKAHCIEETPKCYNLLLCYTLLINFITRDTRVFVPTTNHKYINGKIVMVHVNLDTDTDMRKQYERK